LQIEFHLIRQKVNARVVFLSHIQFLEEDWGVVGYLRRW
jgi:hypothetical protein